MSWTALDFGKHQGKSLPQVLFSDPDWFFWAVETGVFKTRPAFQAQAKDLYQKAKRIKVKQPGVETVVVEHFIHLPTMKYSHFTVVPESQGRHLGSSPTIREPMIDMSVPRRIAQYDKTGCKSLVSFLKLHHFGSKSARMTKEKCETFFDTPANFA